MIHTIKSFGIVNKAEIHDFLELLCFLDDPMDIGNLISGSSAFSKSSLYVWKFSVQLLLKPSLKDFEHDPAGMWIELNCVVVWTLPFLLTFSSPVATAEFSKFVGILSVAL